jgi:Leucine-rich repeat (LRR) protein
MKKTMEKAIISGLTFFFIVILYIDGGLCVCLNSTHFKMTGTSNTIINNNWFFNCTGAKFLDMSNNNFIKVGNESFDTLWRIQELNLGYNNISVIEPEALAIMRSLEHLYIDHNELVELPLDFFMNKNNLISVDLSYNNITHIPLAVFNYSMIKLDRVLLHHNQITACEPWAYVKQAIRLVDVRYNQVSTFTNDANWTYTSRTVYDEVNFTHFIIRIVLDCSVNQANLTQLNSKTAIFITISNKILNNCDIMFLTRTENCKRECTV